MPRLGSLPLDKIRALDLDTFYTQLRTNGSSEGGPLSARTVRLCHTVVSQTLDQARRWGLVARNVAADATVPKTRKGDIDPPSVDTLPVVAGAAGMPLHRFLLWNIPSAFAWAAATITIGAAFGDDVVGTIDRAGGWLSAAAVATAVIVVVRRRRWRRTETAGTLSTRRSPPSRLGTSALSCTGLHRSDDSEAALAMGRPR